ncbi:MAG: hypothetical protein QOG99_3434 [Frankiales bacterium]|jgi:hypothetical protein|nr:hypothetical protein [Frankiales bacterium]
MRIEQSPVGQAVIGAFALLVVLAVGAWNLPAGRPHDRAVGTFGPVTQGLGLEQDWALFAPDPRSFGVGVHATLTYRDGHTRRWDPPHNGVFVAPYRTYRWQKYVERLRADDYSGLWDPTARWLAREYGPGVTKVVLTRTFRDVATPGDSKPRPQAGRFDFYTLDLP